MTHSKTIHDFSGKGMIYNILHLFSITSITDREQRISKIISTSCVTGEFLENSVVAAHAVLIPTRSLVSRYSHRWAQRLRYPVYPKHNQHGAHAHQDHAGQMYNMQPQGPQNMYAHHHAHGRRNRTHQPWANGTNPNHPQYIEGPGPWEKWRQHLQNTGQPLNIAPGFLNGPRPDGWAGWRGRWEQKMVAAMGPAPVVGAQQGAHQGAHQGAEAAI